MKVKLQTEKKKPIDSSYCKTIQWKESYPFLVNPRAKLIHRVKHVHSTIIEGKHSHDTALYWCNNIGRGEFTDDPPKDRLLCSYCEANAVAAGEKPASELAGRHICTGVMKVARTCCIQVDN